jgi:hypothetical protein
LEDGCKVGYDGEEVAVLSIEDVFCGVEYFLLVFFMCMGLSIGCVVVGGQSQK